MPSFPPSTGTLGGGFEATVIRGLALATQQSGAGSTPALKAEMATLRPRPPRPVRPPTATPPRPKVSRPAAVLPELRALATAKPRPPEPPKPAEEAKAAEKPSPPATAVDAAGAEDSTPAVSASASAVGAGVGDGEGDQVASGGGTGGQQDDVFGGDAQPLFQPEPNYPRAALAAGREGKVKVEFTIQPDGSTGDIKVVSSDPPGVFDREAVRAVSLWRYAPPIVNGVPVERPNVQIEIEFKLEGRRSPVSRY